MLDAENSCPASQASIKFTLELTPNGTKTAMSKFTVTEEWAILWVKCLFANLDYGAYSIARDYYYGEEDCVEKYKGDYEFELMKSLEAKYPLLRELYEDFGEEREFWRIEINDAKWMDWFKKNKHLFIEEIKEIENSGDLNIKNGHILLHIPIYKNIEETLDLTRKFLEENIYNNKDRVRIEPKYRLLIKQGKTMLSLNAVKRAVLAGTNNDLDNLKKELNKEDRNDVNPSIEAGMVDFVCKNYELLGLSWSDDEVKYLMTKRKFPLLRNESIRANIGLWRDQFKSLCANTIRGRFPDTTPFDSRSWDAFRFAAVSPARR